MSTREPADGQTRENTRYDFAVPMIIEFGNGFLRAPDRTDAILVDLSQGGAAIVCPSDDRIRQRKRYRVWVDDYAGIIEIRNIRPLDDGRVRLGVAFKGLGLELQELVADTLQNAQFQTSRFAGDSAAHPGIAHADIEDAA